MKSQLLNADVASDLSKEKRWNSIVKQIITAIEDGDTGVEVKLTKQDSEEFSKALESKGYSVSESELKVYIEGLGFVPVHRNRYFVSWGIEYE